MNKKLMLLGLCLMGVFSSLHANDAESVVNDTTVVSDTTITTASEENKEIQQTNEDCDCGKKKS